MSPAAAGLRILHTTLGLGAVVGILLDGRDLAVRIRHECLEHIVKGLRLLGSVALGCALTAIVKSAAVAAAVAAMISVIVIPLRPVKIPLATVLAGLTLRRLLGLLDGKIDLSSRVNGNDLHLDLLTNGEMLVDIADIGMGHFRDMYHTALVAGQGDKCAKLGNARYLSFYNGSYFELHN